MIEMRNDQLQFSFPDVHPDAVLHVEFQRTLRIPDDDRTYPLPPGLGRFPLRHVDDFAARVPDAWRTHGGVLLPMYQSEAMWLNFHAPHDYPFALKIATGRINAVTGEAWQDGLNSDPQDYVVVPGQPWLDGYCIEKGIIRQFVALPLGSGYSAEEQLTGRAEHGGVQLVAYPMKREFYEELRRRRPQTRYAVYEDMGDAMMCLSEAAPDMGLAPGGRMEQEIYDDDHPFDAWDLRQRSRCFVHLANSLVWRAITGSEPPTPPPTAAEYARAGLPWFEYYNADATAVAGAERLRGLKSVAQLATSKGDVVLPENESVEPGPVVTIRGGRSTDAVREGAF